VIADAVARRYLLGDTNEDERAAVEEDYFRHSASADHIAEIEEELIEDYLAGRLGSEDRQRFEQVYMSSPAHRIRVEFFRRLVRPAQRRTSALRGWFALAAAAVIVVVLGSLWFLVARRDTPRTSAGRQPAPTPTAASGAQPDERGVSAGVIPPAAFAISLSPLNVRSAGGAPTYNIPESAAIVKLQLEGEPSRDLIRNGRVAIETIEGRTAWSGCAVTGDTAGVIARTDVPAANLPRGDYIVRLFEKDASGAGREHGRYVLRIR
jgi:hypothetical protein